MKIPWLVAVALALELASGCGGSGSASFEYLMIYDYQTGGGWDAKAHHYEISGPGFHKEASSWDVLAKEMGINPDKVKGYFVVAIMNELGRDRWELVSVSEASVPDLAGNIHHVSTRWTFKRDWEVFQKASDAEQPESARGVLDHCDAAGEWRVRGPAIRGPIQRRGPGDPGTAEDRPAESRVATH